MNEVAIIVSVKAHAFTLEVLIASIIASFEKNPARYGVPIRAKLPTVTHVVVKGRVFCKPPIFRMSCSSFKL